MKSMILHFLSKKSKKMEFHEKIIKSLFNLWRMFMRIISV